jgi:hypothetical protein
MYSCVLGLGPRTARGARPGPAACGCGLPLPRARAAGRWACALRVGVGDDHPVV